MTNYENISVSMSLANIYWFMFLYQSWPQSSSRALWQREVVSHWPVCQAVLSLKTLSGSEMGNLCQIQSSRPGERMLGTTIVQSMDRNQSDLHLWLWMFNVSRGLRKHTTKFKLQAPLYSRATLCQGGELASTIPQTCNWTRSSHMINFIIYDCVFLSVSCEEDQLLQEYTWISS